MIWFKRASLFFASGWATWRILTVVRRSEFPKHMVKRTVVALMVAFVLFNLWEDRRMRTAIEKFGSFEEFVK